jgi:hypothetical protein
MAKMVVWLNIRGTSGLIKGPIFCSSVSVSSLAHGCALFQSWCHSHLLYIFYRKEYLLETNSPGGTASSTTVTAPGITSIPHGTPPSIQLPSSHSATPPTQVATHPSVQPYRRKGVGKVPEITSHQPAQQDTPDSLAGPSHMTPLTPLAGPSHMTPPTPLGLEVDIALTPSSKMSAEVKPYVRKRVWDGNLQRFVINHSHS